METHFPAIDKDTEQHFVANLYLIEKTAKNLANAAPIELKADAIALRDVVLDFVERVK